MIVVRGAEKYAFWQKIYITASFQFKIMLDADLQDKGWSMEK